MSISQMQNLRPLARAVRMAVPHLAETIASRRRQPSLRESRVMKKRRIMRKMKVRMVEKKAKEVTMTLMMRTIDSSSCRPSLNRGSLNPGQGLPQPAFSTLARPPSNLDPRRTYTAPISMSLAFTVVCVRLNTNHVTAIIKRFTARHLFLATATTCRVGSIVDRFYPAMEF
jgi:hypothetical protein